MVILIGVFGFAQNSVPGDSFFSLKKIAEKGTAVFVSEKGQAKHDLEVAGKRLDDLTVLQVSKVFEEIAPWQNKRPKFE